MLNNLEEWGTPCLIAHLQKSRQNPAVFSKTKTKGSAQRSCSVLKYGPSEPKVAAKWSSRELTLFPAAVQLQAPSLRVHVQLVLLLAMQLLGPKVPVNTAGNAPGGQNKRDSLPEAMGYVIAKVTWPMERIGQCTVAV